MATISEPRSIGPALKLPPEEQFWKRYSPHHEAPWSLAGSIAVHALVVGGMILFGVYLASLFFQPKTSLPTEVVRLEPGGGGGKPEGQGDGKGGPLPGAAEGPKDDLLNQTGIPDAPRRPALADPAVAKQVEQAYDDPSKRYIQERNSEAAGAFARMDDAIRKRMAPTDDPNPGKGRGGTGQGGGSCTGTGKGDGSGKGDSGKLSNRERRMLRWHMSFTATTGQEYLSQLRGMGAILAIPVTEGNPPTYKVVRDLQPGAKLLDEDVSSINRIYWIDDKPRSVADVLGALGIRLPQLPSRFVAFMPEALEAKLFQMERSYVERVLRQPFNEDRIDETIFRVVLTPTGYKPELLRVSMR